MGSFFTTANPVFVEDFMYKPPVELALSILGKRDQEVQDLVDNMELFYDVPIEFWDKADKDNVVNIQNEINSQVDDISSRYSQDVLNPQFEAEIRKMRRDIERRYNTGDIYNIQKTADNKRAMDAELAKLDPQAQSVYRAMFDNYLRDNPEGSISNIFEGDNVFNTMEPFNDFMAAAAQGLKADGKQYQIKSINGSYYVDQGGSVQELSKEKLQTFFKGWLEANRDTYSPYFQSRQKYTGDRWLDESGQYDWSEGSRLETMLNDAVPSLAYKNTTTQKATTYNEAGIAAIQEASWKRQQEYLAKKQEQEAQEKPLGAKNADHLFNTKIKAIKDYRDVIYNKIASDYGLKSLNSNKSFSDIHREISNMDPKKASQVWGISEQEAKQRIGNAANTIQGYEAQYKQQLTASYQPYANYVTGDGQKWIDGYVKNGDNLVKTKGGNIKGELILDEGLPQNIKGYLKDMNLSNVSINDLQSVFQSKYVPGSGGMVQTGIDQTTGLPIYSSNKETPKIKVSYIPESTILVPMMNPATQKYDEGSDKYSLLQTTLNIEENGFNYQVDFYLPTSELSSDSSIIINK